MTCLLPYFSSSATINGAFFDEDEQFLTRLFNFKNLDSAVREDNGWNRRDLLRKTTAR